MGKFDNCIECFQPLQGCEVCPNCGFNTANYQPKPHCLAPFTRLRNRYMVGRVVGQGGFGVTYVGLDVQTNRRCAIKEYMPSEYASREEGTLRVVPNATTKAQKIFAHGKGKYLLEAESLQKFRKNPIVVDVWGYFEENNTAYIVMEFLDGMDLQKMANARGGKIELAFVLDAFKVIASALMDMHAGGILHRDLKPENIFFTKDGRFKLFDFGSARDYVRAEKMGEGLSVLLTPGYAPPEQYSKNGNQGPWTDVYALCATFYRLVSGKKPKDGLSIAKGVPQLTLAEMDCGVSPGLSEIIRKGMEPDVKKRYKGFKELLDDLDKESRKKGTKPAGHIGPRPINSSPNPNCDPGRKNGGGGGNTPKGSQNDDPKSKVKTGGASKWWKNFGNRNKKTAANAAAPDSGSPSGGNPGGGSHSGGSSPAVSTPKPPARPPYSNGYVYSGVQPPANVKGTKAGRGSGMAAKGVNHPGSLPVTKKQARIRVISGEKTGVVELIPSGEEIRIGRNNEECQIVLQQDTNVSRVHCKVSFDERAGIIYLMDVSSNGTYFSDGRRLNKNQYYPLQPGSRFYIVSPQHMLQVDIV